MKALGKGLQVFALILLPLAMFMQLTGSETFRLDQMLVMMVFGLVTFYLGRILEGYSRS